MRDHASSFENPEAFFKPPKGMANFAQEALAQAGIAIKLPYIQRRIVPDMITRGELERQTPTSHFYRVSTVAANNDSADSSEATGGETPPETDDTHISLWVGAKKLIRPLSEVSLRGFCEEAGAKELLALSDSLSRTVVVVNQILIRKSQPKG